MRILHIGVGNLYGGIEALLVTLARNRHCCEDLDQAFATFFPGRLRNELLSSGATAHTLDPVRLSRPWTIAAARRQFAEIVPQYDCIIGHSAWPYLIAAPVGRRQNIPCALWVHGTPSGNWLERMAGLTPPDLIIANSVHTAAAVERILAPRCPLHVLYNPVTPAPVASRAEVRLRMKTPADAIVILQAGRMEEWKGHRLHIQALSQLASTPGWECWIAGGAQRPAEAAYLASLQALAAQHGVLDRIRFLGQRDDVRSLMAAADIFCQPNTAPEPFGIVFVEALWAGLPVVATSFGGAREIVNESCGCLATPGDASGLAHLLRHLILSAEYRKELGGNGPQRAYELSDPARQTKSLRDLLQALSSPLTT